MTYFRNQIVAVCCLVWPLAAAAEPVSVNVVLSTTESIKMDFADGSKHFVLLVRREGTAEGEGVLNGASVVEYGWHDITPGESGDPLGYMEMTTPSGDIAYLKWHVRGVFMGGDYKGPPKVHGVWELTSGTGAFAELRGIGSMSIGVVDGPDDPRRRFSLTGDIGPTP